MSLAQVRYDHLTHGLERLEDALASDGHPLEISNPSGIDLGADLFSRYGIGHV